MSKNFKNMAIGTVALGVAAAGTLGLGAAAVSAQFDGNQDFVSSLATKLGVEEDAVQSAITATREEFRAERQAELEQQIADAVTSGGLTERQADIIAAMQEIREEKRNDLADLSAEERQALREERRSNFADLSTDERDALKEELHSERQTEIIAALAEKGISVTAAELDELHETLEELGIRKSGGHHQRGPKGGFGKL